PCAAGTPHTTSLRGYRDKARAPQGPTVGTTSPFRLREANNAPHYLYADPRRIFFGCRTGEVRLARPRLCGSRVEPALQLRDRCQLVPPRCERDGQTVDLGAQPVDLAALDGRKRRLESEEKPTDPAVVFEPLVERFPRLQQPGRVPEEGRGRLRRRRSGRRRRGTLRRLQYRRLERGGNRWGCGRYDAP